jgi:hypothetical protein
MTAISEFLFPAPARRTTGAIMRWWEARRLRYNLVVGAAGFTSIGFVNLIAALPPDGHTLGVPWGGVLVVGMVANVCYLFGPSVEIGIEKLFGGRILPTGPALFRMGLTFSTGLALLPCLLASFDWVNRIVRALF